MKRHIVIGYVLVQMASLALANSDPVVGNVTVSQRTDRSRMVDMRYDLADADGDLCTVSLAVSSDGGSTWAVAASSLSGDIGAGIAPGDGKLITWDCGKDLPGVYGVNYRIKVIANDGYMPIPPDMVIIPAGNFQMGDSKGDGYSDELPVHTVAVDSFAMGKYEITNGQYCAFLKSAYPSQLKVVNGVVYSTNDTGNSYPYCDTSPSSSYSQISFSNNTFSVRTKGGKDMTSHPMVCVSWYGAVAYCNWRSQQEGKQICYTLSTWECDFNKKGYRLATEAEWEYAARGGLSGKRFPWGDTITHSKANYDSSSSYSYDTSPTRGYHPTWNDGIYPYTSQIGSFPANGYGLFDMAGNVWEWCHDWFGSYSSDSQINPTGPAMGSSRVDRGGSWLNIAFSCRVSNRSYGYYPDGRRRDIGFRVVLDF
jgi:sulfatase modifying factor 1